MQINKKIRESNFTDNQSTLYIALIPPDRNTAAREMGSQYMLLPAHLSPALTMHEPSHEPSPDWLSPAARSQKGWSGKNVQSQCADKE